MLFAGTVWVVRPREERREVSLLLRVEVRREMGLWRRGLRAGAQAQI